MLLPSQKPSSSYSLLKFVYRSPVRASNKRGPLSSIAISVLMVSCKIVLHKWTSHLVYYNNALKRHALSDVKYS